MTIPETLAEMRHLMQRKTILQDQLERARSAATSSGGIGDGIPHGTTVDPKVERYGLYIADLSAQIDQINRKLDLFSDDVRKALARVNDTRDAEILRMRYLEYRPVQEIAEKMNYERKWLYDLLKKAEKALT